MKNQKLRPIMAAMGALSVSSFITSVLGAFLFGIAYALFDGPLQKAAFILSGIIILAFFVWLGLHAYKVELSMMIGGYGAADERALTRKDPD